MLIAGGSNDTQALSSAELYDPLTGAWSATGSLSAPRNLASAVLLANGKVLITGGLSGNSTLLNTAEAYDPATGTWSATGSFSNARVFHTATLLASGKVMIVGGNNNLNMGLTLRSAELYDPATGTWSATGNLITTRQTHTATLLQNDKVLISAGFANNSTTLTSAELYDPAIGAWSATGNLSVFRETAMLLPNGKVLATGGDGGSITTELYNPVTGAWSAGANLTTKRNSHTVTLLSNAKVLAAAGTGDGQNGLSSAELFDAAALGGATVTVSAASYGVEVASEAIVSAFGANLASSTLAATTLPLPTSLAGATVKVKDSAATERNAPLFFVSPGQINYQIPPGTAVGIATITITNGASISTGMAQIGSTSPGLFTFNAAGTGVVAAVARRFRNNQELPSETVAQLDAQNQWITRPIDLGPETDLVILEMFGTGFRSHGNAPTAVKIGEADAQVFYVGLAPGFVGLDQLDVSLPRSLIGRGEVDIVLTVDGKTANTVKVNVR